MTHSDFRPSLMDDSEPDYAPLVSTIRGKPYWVPSKKYREAGYAIKTKRLEGTPHEVAHHARDLTRELLAWWEGRAVSKIHPGTWAWLIKSYLTHPDSALHDVRPATRQQYRAIMARIEAAIGNVLIEDTDFVRMNGWRRAMKDKGRSDHYIHSWFRHFGLVVTHGVKLRVKGCADVREVRSAMRIKSVPSRHSFINRDQAHAIIDAARAKGWNNLALSVMIRFELMLRGVDVEGIWAPTEGREGGITHKGMMWEGGLTWGMISDDLTKITKVISKTRASLPEAYTFDITPLTVLRAMLDETPAAKRTGPVILGEAGLPCKPGHLARRFKHVVRALKLPDTLRISDCRPGGITEAKGMVDPMTLRDAAGHTQVSTTDGYVRGRSDSAGKVIQLRAARTNG